MIGTERLILRPWREADLDPFAAMGADEEVMRHLGGTIDRPSASASIAKQAALYDRDGFGFMAVERRDDGAFLGFCGLRISGHPGTPVPEELEIGWRLARAYWGQGYACEAAAASIADGWAPSDRTRIAAWTVPANTASWGLMLRLGMRHRPELDFDHPALEAGHPLRRHVVYTVERTA